MTGSVQELADKFAKRVLEESKHLEERECAVKRARIELEEEKARMQAFTDQASANRDIVEINVGGDILATKRETLLLAQGTMLEAMFSGRWESSLQRDSQGRVFLDYSPAVFRLLLSHLRVTRDLLPEKAPVPCVPDELKAEFETMLRFLGMHTFVLGFTRLNFTFFERGFTANDIASYENNVFKKVSGQAHCMFTSQPLQLCSSRPSFSWSIVIKALSNWFFLGVTASTTFEITPAHERTSFGWSTKPAAWGSGVATRHKDGWSGWAVGDVVRFTVDSTSKTLQMRTGAAQSTFTLDLTDVVMDKIRVCVGLSEPGAELELVA